MSHTRACNSFYIKRYGCLKLLLRILWFFNLKKNQCARETVFKRPVDTDPRRQRVQKWTTTEFKPPVDINSRQQWVQRCNNLFEIYFERKRRKLRNLLQIHVLVGFTSFTSKTGKYRSIYLYQIKKFPWRKEKDH